jgi:arylsulfatase
VHWPAGLKTSSGTYTSQPGHLIDFMATFLDVGKAAYPKQIGERVIDPLQGISLNPIFRGEQRKPHDTLYFHFGTDRALRQGDWKLVSAKRGRWELYNMEADRTELYDLAAEQPERVKAMSAVWFDMAKNIDRVKGKQLAQVKDDLTDIHFRKDTSDQLVPEDSK